MRFWRRKPRCAWCGCPLRRPGDDTEFRVCKADSDPYRTIEAVTGLMVLTLGERPPTGIEKHWAKVAERERIIKRFTSEIAAAARWWAGERAREPEPLTEQDRVRFLEHLNAQGLFPKITMRPTPLSTFRGLDLQWLLPRAPQSQQAGGMHVCPRFSVPHVSIDMCRMMGFP